MQDKQDKRRAFQEAQQSVEQVNDAYSEVIQDSPDYGAQLKTVRQEMDEAYQQIQSALVTASEHQRLRLEQYEQELLSILNEIGEE